MEHINAMNLGSRLHKRPIEKVSVIGDKDSWLDFLHMREKSAKTLFLFHPQAKIASVSILK